MLKSHYSRPWKHSPKINPRRALRVYIVFTTLVKLPLRPRCIRTTTEAKWRVYTVHCTMYKNNLYPHVPSCPLGMRDTQLYQAERNRHKKVEHNGRGQSRSLGEGEGGREGGGGSAACQLIHTANWSWPLYLYAYTCHAHVCRTQWPGS